jgi:hypothetical protein
MIRKITATLGILSMALLLAFTPTTDKSNIVDAGHGGHDTGKTVDESTKARLIYKSLKKSRIAEGKRCWDYFIAQR